MIRRSVHAAILRPRRHLGMLVVLAAAALAAPARAETDAPARRAVEAYLAEAEPWDRAIPGELPLLLAAAEEERAAPWTFTAALYLWATDIEGDVAAGGTTTSIDVPFSELFDDLTGAFMGRFGARKGKWGILLDVIWSAIEDSTTGPGGGTITTEMDMFIAELTGSYTILGFRREAEDGQAGEAPKGLFTLDAYAGARVYSIEVELTTALASPEQSETWVDPIVGLDARYRTHKWLFLARADIGGFEISSELCWSVTLGVAFQCTRIFWLGAGYRWLDLDFESGGTGFTDVQLSGPYFAMVFAW
jgi:hypothetical protein